MATVARRYRLSPAQVADWNSVATSAAFHAGQQVVVYLPVKVGGRSASAKAGKGTRKAASTVPSKKTAKPKKK